MRGFVANTELEWFETFRSAAIPPDEVNFWRPGADASFKAVRPGEPLFFKLKMPHNAIAGFGFFAHFSPLPIAVAWDVYGHANGAASFSEFRERLLRARIGELKDPHKDLWAGCILLNKPLFFEEHDWIRVPEDWTPTIGQGMTYDLSRGEGKRIWAECLALARSEVIFDSQNIPGGHGTFSLMLPRLGPRSFRIAVLDCYGRRCAVTDEAALPALAAAHIRVDGELPVHSVNNGILFRADIQKLFDAGYVTVTPEMKLLVSGRMKEEFANGREYERLHEKTIRLPEDPGSRPLTEALWWHNEERFLG
jgi:putative restriction endonuclease